MVVPYHLEQNRHLRQVLHPVLGASQQRIHQNAHVSPRLPFSQGPNGISTALQTKERYFARLSADISPDKPAFEESRWITSDDVNVGHLLDVFTTIDRNSDHIWDACSNFMLYLFWHRGRLTVLGPKIEGLPDDHPSKPGCLFILAQLLDSVGNWVEKKRLLACTLDLWRERESNDQVVLVLMVLSDTNRVIGLREEGMQQAREALEIYERLGDTGKQADSLIKLARLLGSENQFDAAEEAAFRAIALLPGESEQFRVCQSRLALNGIYQSKGEIDKAIHHHEAIIGVATPFNWNDELFWAHYYLGRLFHDGCRFDDAQPHVERASRTRPTTNTTWVA